MSLIDREQAINLLWKTLFDFEDENEKEFSEEWYLKIRPQVQNISDLSRQAILNMPSAEKTGRWEPIPKMGDAVQCSNCKKYWAWTFNTYEINYCPNCGSRMEE